MLAEAGFVLVVDYDSLIRMLLPGLFDLLGERLFLKVSCAAGSVSGWVVRGIRSL